MIDGAFAGGALVAWILVTVCDGRNDSDSDSEGTFGVIADGGGRWGSHIKSLTVISDKWEDACMEAHIAEAGAPLLAKTGFGRIFEGMYQGSMVGAGPNVFAVWPYVIAHMRAHAEHGALVELNPKLLGFIFGTTEPEVEAAIEYLCKADPRSRSKAEDGRRLVRLGEFLYRVVNGAGYLAVRRGQDARFNHALRQARYSKKKRAKGPTEKERQFEKALAEGDEAEADRIVGSDLPGADNGTMGA